MAINPDDFINWLTTQKNATGSLFLRSEAERYAYLLRTFSLKLNIPLPREKRNVFIYRTIEQVDKINILFLKASNIDEINLHSKRAFFSSIREYRKYLEYLGKKNGIKTKNKKITIAHVKQLRNILSIRFPNGFRIGSQIELTRFRNFAKEDNINIKLTDEDLVKFIINCGTLFDGKVYIVSLQAKNRLKKIVDTYFANGAQVIFYIELFNKNDTWLYEANIISKDMLKNILLGVFPELKFKSACFGYINNLIPNIIENEILRVWGNNILLSYKQLEERLYYIPLDKIKSILSKNDDFIWNNKRTFIHISKIDITKEEKITIQKVVKNECDSHGYVSIASLSIDGIIERNHELSITAIHDAVFRICLSDNYNKNGKIITYKGTQLNAQDIMKNYCLTIDKCSLNDLLMYEKELTGEVHYWISMEVANSVLIRINKDTYIADKYINFDSKIIDKAIERFVANEYLPLISFTTFSTFPDCGQPWNLFLLESYCRRFSKKFRFEAPSVNSRNAGTIIRKSCIMTYTEIMADAVAKSDVYLDAVAVGRYLFDKGYTGKKTNSKITEIIEKAKSIRG